MLTWDIWYDAWESPKVVEVCGAPDGLDRALLHASESGGK